MKVMIGILGSHMLESFRRSINKTDNLPSGHQLLVMVAIFLLFTSRMRVDAG
jgi:hypothetical protein